MLMDYLKPISRGFFSVEPVRGVLHVGAHDGEELNYYKENGISDVVFCEANPKIYKRLVERCQNSDGVKCYNYAICDHKGEVDFHVTNNDSASSSILNLKVHKHYYPHIYNEETIRVPSITIDELFEMESLQPSRYNLLNIDIQGAELLAMKGMKNYLTSCDYVYSEVNFEELYEGCGLMSDIDLYLSQFGFSRITVAETRSGFGDALYAKKK